MINNAKGFTLIELMVTIAILFIMALIALPSWTKLIQDNSISVAVNQVESVYQLARSEALKRHETITLTSTDARHTWTITDSSSATLKTINLSTENVSIAETESASEVSIDIKRSGFSTNTKIGFSWENEYRCLNIYSSGQSKISSNSGDCA